MELKIIKVGNSAGVCINQPLLKQLKARIGTSLVAEVRNGGLFLKPSTEPQYSLEALLSSCTKDNMRRSEEDEVWLDSAPVGKER